MHCLLKELKVRLREKTLETKARSEHLKQNQTAAQRDTSGHSLDDLKVISLTRLIGANVKQAMLTHCRRGCKMAQ